MDSDEQEIWIGVEEDLKAPYDVEQAFNQLHNELEVSFPRSFVQIHERGVTKIHGVVCDGGRVENCDLHGLLVPRFESWGSDIRAAKNLILKGISESNGWFDKVVPFGQDGSGGQYCFDGDLEKHGNLTVFSDER